MKLKSFLLFGLVAVVIAVTSCSDKDLFDQKAYEEMVANTFPVQNVDPQHDWATTKSNSVIVEIGYLGDYVLKFYSDNPSSEDAVLFSSINLAGGDSYSVSFLTPTDQNEVYAALESMDGWQILKKVNLSDTSRLLFGNNSAAKAATRSALSDVTVTVGDYVEYERDVTKSVTEALPENVSAAGKTCNYEFVSNGEFTMMPVYGRTSSDDEIGIYFYDPTTETIADRKEITFAPNINDGTWCNIQWHDYEGWSNQDFKSDAYFYAYDWWAYKLRGKQITINAPVGYRVGFFVVTSTNKFYSNNALNEDGNYYSVAFNQDGNFYVGLEDWLQAWASSQGQNTDCNDVVFSVSAANDSNIPDIVVPSPKVETPQTYTYCYEDNFPEPGDYDFNDVVMRVKMTKGRSGNKDCLNIDVTMRAVGASKRLAGALRLAGIKTSNLKKLKRDGSNYYFNYGEQDLLPQSKHKDFMTMPSTGDAVIPLFNDAHYFINGGKKDADMLPKRRFYNTLADRANEKGDEVPEKTLSYQVIFNGSNSDSFNSFTEQDLDLFIIEEFNGTAFEVHTYPYKTHEVINRWMFSGNGVSPYSDNYPWAVMVPGNFKYPVEWQPIGTYKNNIISGAYLGFSYWAQNHNSNTDWYKNPQSPELVYE